MPIKVLIPALVENPATFTTLRATSVLSIPGFEDVSASLAAAGGGTTPTLQQVTDQGSSTTTPITASIISASGNIITNTLTASGLIYPTVDGTDGQVIVTDGAGNLSFGHGEKLHLQVRNDDSVDITAGTPIYSTGEIGGSERIKVRIASASDASKMPAIGIVETTLTTIGATRDGFAIINGIYNTNVTPVSGTPALGDNIYVHADGGVTTIKPSGSNLIQNIGTVLKTNGTIIQGMKVSSIDRTNDVPNLLDNTIFFGSGSDQTQQIHISGALDQTIINNITASGNISASGEITTNGLTNVGSTSTTLSSSFTTTLNFSTNRIMSVTTGSALTMSIDEGNSILGNVIMTDISSSVGLNLPSSEFKVLNGTFDTTKRNYVYYHYIGNDTALVTINQES